MGTANIAKRSVMPAIRTLHSEYELSAVGSRDLERANLLNQDYGVRTFGSYDALIESDDLDALYIPLPTGLHYKWVKRALHKGLHVLVEKSLGMNPLEVEELTCLARANNLVMVENFQFRFHPQLEILKRVIEAGELGELRCLRASFGFPPFSSKENIRYKAELGGGALFDAGAYTIKIAQILLGCGLSVKAANLSYDSELGVDIWGGAYLESAEKKFAQVAFGFDHQYRCDLEFWGSRGRLYTSRLFTAPSDYEPELVLETATGTRAIKAPAQNQFENMLRHFHHLVTSGEGLEEEHVQNLDQAQVLEAIRRVAGKG